MTRKKLRLNLAVMAALVFLITDGSAQQQNRRQGFDRQQRRGQRDMQNNNTVAAQAPPGKGFDAYRMVETRNIFDPDRRPMQLANVRPVNTTQPPGRSDFVAVTGTMVT